MADEFREELIGISEKLGKYSGAMQESLNILSDEFLLLRDELSTLNQSLEKTRDLDAKLDEFNKTVTVLHGLSDKLKTLEKVADSLSVADQLSAKVDQLAIAVGSNKEKMSEAVTPLSKKMDLLFSKFEETLSPVNKKLDAMGEEVREELRETTEALKGEETIKTLSVALADELKKMEAAFSEQSNSIKSISTSVAFLSNSEGEVKKSIDSLTKIYQQDREKLALEKSGKEDFKRQIDVREQKLDEIVALLHVQSEQMQKQQSLIEAIKPQKGPSQQNEILMEEVKKQGERFEKLEKTLGDQVKMLALMRDSLPTGNFEEVIKHADLINQSTNQKLDSVIEMNNAATKAVVQFNDKATQLPSLMQNISVALDTLVSEMKKSQVAYKSLEAAVHEGALLPQQPSAGVSKLESITESMKAAPHPKAEPQIAEQPQGASREQFPGQPQLIGAPMQQQYDAQLKEVIAELKRFEEIENLRIEKMAAVSATAQTSQPATPASAISDAVTQKIDTSLVSIKKELANLSAGVEGLKSVLVSGTDITAEVDFTPVMKKIDLMQNTIANLMQAPQVAAAGTSQGLSGAQISDQRELLEEVQQNIRIFQSFELSDRAKIVVDRLDMLVKRCLSLYSN